MKSLVVIILSVLYAYIIGVGAELVAGGPATVPHYAIPSRTYLVETVEH